MAPAKKTVAKKPAVKKTTVKKTTVKKQAVVQEPVMVAKNEKFACECDAKCACGANCACGGKCGCRGGGFWRFLGKLIILAIVFALGFATAKMCCCGGKFGPMNRGARPVFVNGCLDVASVKCPKMVEMLPAFDVNADGCITREEYRAVKREMRK